LDAVVATNQYQWHHKHSDAMQWQQDCYCSTACDNIRIQNAINCSDSKQAIQGNGKGLIVAAFVPTTYCCIFAVSS